MLVRYKSIDRAGIIMSIIRAYIIDHDRGFAPRIERGVCILHGCKKNTIEKNAKVGDWIIGIGGRGPGGGKYYRKLIYAMKVQVPSPPRSRVFWFFGDKAIEFPDKLYHILLPTKYRTKYFRDETTFSKFEKFIKRYPKGKIGQHCDKPSIRSSCK